MVGLKDQPFLLPLEVDQLVTVVNPGTILDYAEWWRSVFARAFPSPLECYLSKLVGGSHGRSSQPPRLATNKAQASSKPAPKSKSKSQAIRCKCLNLSFS